MNKASLWISCLVLFLLAGCTNAGKQAAEKETTFTNPVIYADVPDVDVIRVGSDYYMISTTAHMSPGAPIMHSKDMVNWKIISYVFDELPCFVQRMLWWFSFIQRRSGRRRMKAALSPLSSAPPTVRTNTTNGLSCSIF